MRQEYAGGSMKSMCTDGFLLGWFDRCARSASFHYADDSTSEWKLADQQKADALSVFDANPHLQERMRILAIGNLWSLNMERPVKDSA